MPPTARMSPADAFEGVRSLLWLHVWTFHDRYGDEYGTPDELFSEASLAFTHAVRSYNPAKGRFTTHLWPKVAGALLSLRTRKEAKRAERPQGSPLDWEPDEPDSRNRWAVTLAELSDDARAVVRLATDTPRGLARVIAENAEDISDARAYIRQYLFGAGWSADRIDRTFDEVRETLE